MNCAWQLLKSKESNLYIFICKGQVEFPGTYFKFVKRDFHLIKHLYLFALILSLDLTGGRIPR